MRNTQANKRSIIVEHYTSEVLHNYRYFQSNAAANDGRHFAQGW